MSCVGPPVDSSVFLFRNSSFGESSEVSLCCLSHLAIPLGETRLDLHESFCVIPLSFSLLAPSPLMQYDILLQLSLVRIASSEDALAVFLCCAFILDDCFSMTNGMEKYSQNCTIHVHRS